MTAFQVKGRWRAQYVRYGNKGIVVLAVLMALTGTALILAGMQQPKASVTLPGGSAGPSRNELKGGMLQEARKAVKQKGGLTRGCPMLRVPKVRKPALDACTSHRADKSVAMRPPLTAQRPAEQHKLGCLHHAKCCRIAATVLLCCGLPGGLHAANLH